MKNTSTQSDKDSSKIEDIISINDLRELDNNNNLTTDQRVALKNFERYRASELNKQRSEIEFNKKYKQLQVMSNLYSYEEFLKEIYFI